LKVRKMSNTTIRSIILSLAFVLLSTISAHAENGEEWPKHILKHLISLRIEFAEHLSESQQARLVALKRELEETLQQQKGLQEDEDKRVQQILHIEQQLAAPQLEQPARPQIQALKEHLIGEEAGKLLSGQAALAQRQTQIRQRLQAEQEREQKLQGLLRTLYALLGQN
jgi:hypothetical protein